MFSYQYLQLDLLSNFNTACSSVSLHRQLKTRLALSLAVRGYSPTQTHYTIQMKHEMRREKWHEISFNSSTSTTGCYDEM